MAANIKEMKNEKKEQLFQLTNEFSRIHLNEEYDVVIEKLINKMARKREVPFLKGRIDIWAAAIIHALGTINFLFDKDTEPYVSSPSVIYDHFNTKQSTTSQRSKQIRDMFNLSYFDSTFGVESVNKRSPFNQLTTIDGFIVPKSIIEEEFVISDWELRVAEIIGLSLVKKAYSDLELSELLQVTDERLLRYHAFLQKEMKFPFRITTKQQIGLFLIEEHIDFIRLEQDIKVHHLYGILVECIQKEEKKYIPLAELELDESHENYNLVNDYQGWFWNYR
ncbi:DUF6398 domain-containing protein [Oceanobacillus indicireducens]|uniref:DUF6398 domain-containing protein n=1 Tax=Oceanobacillus indicireducens TaxID=1004261 RepID=A0A918D186_9BACI|nr:DUF6398 domain-containing protein [Oceanobacillus indicireducens]GGN57393.1 hypothetical protein GCM10007971_18280 [Oceanobacillus indicireducens]